jgi:hypothetical protein
MVTASHKEYTFCDILKLIKMENMSFVSKQRLKHVGNGKMHNPANHGAKTQKFALHAAYFCRF